MNALTERAAPMVEFHDQIERRAIEFAKALRQSGIDPALFERVAKTAVALNPKLLAADRRSLFNSLARCAEDGLLPNGKEAVLKIYNSKEGPIVGAERMVAGIRKLVQQSGEITRFEQTIVYANDQFDFELGDHPRILHRPKIGDRGEPILLYSVAQFNDGTLSREVMSAEEIETIRQRYSTAKDGPAWRNSWGEMARKTIAKRHAKVLPMSSDARNVLDRDDEPDNENRPRFADRPVDIGGHTSQPETPAKAKRGRPLKKTDDDPSDAEIERSQSRLGTVLGEFVEEEIREGMREGDWPDKPDDASVSADFMVGEKDAEAGRAGCLNRDIREDKKRLADWQRGFDSVKRK